ncbi:5-formyltetrahydrofolate cyclo-ligase [Annulohypoxylon truncatum]|uniref:5-formyltetrahydrofolate cyclo-ligase n=1 Tax=Annulohypoxylon truncatum TaxID=327061 RepID=UPI002008465A|nr:5-formyltetrahydrofolate cyclo-ligase [Annulohypoxylon truncatum]KAI1214099.1 5-formyltetrahydrofolate cyclo-ligase [Annulohypoxylon truncatum]
MSQGTDMNSSALSAAKSQLRSLMKQRLANLSHDSIVAQSSKVFLSLSKFKPYVDAKRIAVYLSMPGGEILTDPIVRHALSSGKQVFVPYLHKSGLQPGDGPTRLMDMVSLRDIEDYESLQRDKWGIPSIDAASIHERARSVGELDGNRSEDVSLDLVLLPGVAFDIDPHSKAIRRLGHGRGFYDYFLHRYTLAASPEEKTSNGRPAVLLYALALKEQFLFPSSGESVPVGPHDQPIDGLFLGDGQIKESANENGDAE